MLNARTLRVIADGLLVTALVIVLLMLVQRWRVPSTPAAQVSPPRPVDWQDAVARGQLLGSPAARVRIVEFADFQCPACAYAHTTLKELQARGEEFSITYRHFPLRSYAHSTLAAVAAECAAEQDRFAAFADLLFTEQRWIGVVPWRDLAAQAKVPDLRQFDRCVEERRTLQRVRDDLAAASRLGVSTTPSFVVNGVLISGFHAAELLERIRAVPPAQRRLGLN